MTSAKPSLGSGVKLLDGLNDIEREAIRGALVEFKHRWYRGIDIDLAELSASVPVGARAAFAEVLDAFAQQAPPPPPSPAAKEAARAAARRLEELRRDGPPGLDR